MGAVSDLRPVRRLTKGSESIDDAVERSADDNGVPSFYGDDAMVTLRKAVE